MKINQEQGFIKMKEIVDAIHPLSDADWQTFSAPWQLFDCKRKVILTAAKETERYVYFVLEGVQRSFALTPNDKDVTLVFTYPYSFSGVADSFLLQKPSNYYFETLTPSVFLRTTFAQFDTMMRNNHAIERLIRLAISHTLQGVLVRQIELQSYTSEERFKALFRRSPHILSLVPHKYLASYLGIDPTNFSKLLATVRIE
jgi:CRP-like cAMP-binding protein